MKIISYVASYSNQHQKVSKIKHYIKTRWHSRLLSAIYSYISKSVHVKILFEEFEILRDEIEISGDDEEDELEKIIFILGLSAQSAKSTTFDGIRLYKFNVSSTTFSTKNARHYDDSFRTCRFRVSTHNEKEKSYICGVL